MSYPFLLVSPVALVVLAVVSLWLGGCDSAPSGTVETADGGSDTAEGDPGARCEELLNNAFDMMQPDRLGIDADAETAVDLLNQWLPACGPSEEGGEELSPAATAFLQTLFDAEELKAAQRPRYTPRDARHIRNCLLAKAVTESVIPLAENDLDRVVRLFGYVCRNVALTPDDSNPLPLTPYEILLFGRGSAADRAWVFAELLRQLRIDAVVLRSGSGASERGSSRDDAPWLIGVLLQGEVYLFDARLGSPLPSGKPTRATPTVRRPAALSEVLAEGDLLRQLDVGEQHRYPWTVEDLAGARIEVISHRSFWTPRMKALQMSLSGERSAVIYDGLDGETGAGLIPRVADFGREQWDAEAIGIWPHPEQSFHGFGHMDDRQTQRLLVRQHPFEAPLRPEMNEQEKRLMMVPERIQFKTRTAQLLGNYKSAVRSYLQVRRAGLFPDEVRVPAQLRQMHSRAAEDAFFWIGTCQIELGEYESAAATFRHYLSRSQNGARSVHGRGLLALALAHQGEFGEAVAELNKLPEEAPGWVGYQLWKRRWSRMGDQG